MHLLLEKRCNHYQVGHFHIDGHIQGAHHHQSTLWHCSRGCDYCMSDVGLACEPINCLGVLSPSLLVAPSSIWFRLQGCLSLVGPLWALTRVGHCCSHRKIQYCRNYGCCFDCGGMSKYVMPNRYVNCFHNGFGSRVLSGSIVLLSEMFGDGCWLHSSSGISSCSGTWQMFHLHFCLSFGSSWPSQASRCMGNLSPSIICFKMSYSIGKFLSVFQMITGSDSSTFTSSNLSTVSFITVKYSCMLMEPIFLVEKNLSIKNIFLGLLIASYRIIDNTHCL